MYSIRQIAAAVKGSLIKFSSEALITRLAFDSRKIIEPDTSLFFAIRGKRHDGHLFLNELYQKGVRNFVVTNPEVIKDELPEANIIKVENAIAALQHLAAHHRKKFSYLVIGITGSNGKTIVKEWLFQLLNDDYTIVRSPKSYNSQIGVPLSVWQMNENHTLGIFEAGISMPDEMDGLEEVIRPDIGIFTNIGEAHAEGFLNVRQKINEKLKLFVNSKILIYSLDYPEITQCITEFRHRLPDKEQEEKFRLFTWSRRSDADLKITKVEKKPGETYIEGALKGKPLGITIPFTDEASIENAIHCWAVMLFLKISPARIKEKMQHLGSISMRLELKEGINNCSVINDSYNSDIRSLAIALDFLDQQHQHQKKTLILSDILQTGRNETELYTEVRNMIAEREINRLIGIGKAISEQQKLFPSSNGFESSFFESTDDFLKNFSLQNFSGETILLKGARKFEFEKISKLLEQKIHKTVLEIDLNALVHNLQVYQSLLKPETKVMAMVKAFSYGSGTFEIANVLQYHRVDYLSVAYTDEGVELRKGGILLPIMVMNPETRSFETMLRYNLEPELYSFSVAEKFYKTVEASGKTAYPIHIKIDTGMHRLGFEPHEIHSLACMLKKMPLVKVQSAFSHLAASDEPQHDDFTRSQISRFSQACDELCAGLNYPVMRHILNSGGILRFPEAQFDMVRLGIGLYGVDTTGKIQEKLLQVSTLKSSVSQVKTVKAGESVGYSRSFVAKEQMRIATIGIGYADGIDRRLGNGRGSMSVRGQLAPTVGNICMDLCMIDVTHIPGVEEGDEVIIFGKELPIQNVASQAGTIPYEILTGISERVKRVYFQE
ncbi:MAG TPA: bifunctional UDP-N-acetylmuramoyl-tripeptide:D-alanyl-D-alanine ligase/alanine racemase [Chitinophagales bacterium]|nr:bifunctional UDP-N-acetylmuramoyl-tripeptide:D-alanyl-D-alanine ligase/alanine racemase [Chitinophagales bacterium]